MIAEIAVATGAKVEADGSVSLTLKAVHLQRGEAMVLLGLLRAATAKFAIITGGDDVETMNSYAKTVDEAIADFESRSANKQ